MRSTYRVLAFLIAALVVVQAGAIAWAGSAAARRSPSRPPARAWGARSPDRVFPQGPPWGGHGGWRRRPHSDDTHPMHLHGHHAVVLARDGRAATGSPWWVDSLEVGVGESYDIAFVADNPGLWMDHCHNLSHAAEGLVAHLMYAGVSSSYQIGDAAANEPE